MLTALLIGYYGFGNTGDDWLEIQAKCLLKKVYPTIKIDVIKKNRYKVPLFLSQDMVVYGGGTLFQDKSSFKSFYFYLFFLFLAWIYKKPVIFLGQGIGPIQSKFNRFLFRYLVKKTNIKGTVRDAESLSYLPTPLDVASDLAFYSTSFEFTPKKETDSEIKIENLKSLNISKFFSQEDTGNTKAFWQTRNCCEMKNENSGSLQNTLSQFRTKSEQDTFKDFGGENARSKTFASVSTKNERISPIGVNLRPWNQCDYTLILNAITPLNPLFLSFDQQTDVRLYRELKLPFIPIKPFQTCTLFPFMIVMRYHAAVWAALQGIPFYMISYDPKCTSLAKAMAQPFTELENLTKTLIDKNTLDLSKNLEHYKKTLQKNVQRAKSVADLHEKALVY